MQFSFVCVCVLLVWGALADYKVTQVHLAFRHGDRTPRSVLPKDPVDWEQGVGQLTALGMRQAFDLGTALRSRYSAVFGPQFNPKFGSFFSSNLDRTLMTAQCVAHGIFPPGTGPKLDDGEGALPFGVQPFPIHTVDKKHDVRVLAKDLCPVYQKDLLARMYASDSYRERVARAQPLVDYVAAVTGYPATFEHFYDVYDAIFVQNLHSRLNLPLNESVIADVITLGRTSEYLNHAWDVIGNLGSGVLLSEFQEHMVAALNSTMPTYFLYSGHDSTLMDVFAALRLDRDLPSLRGLPPYSSAVAIELRQQADGRHTVAVVYKRGDRNVFEELPLPPPCSRDECSFEQWTELMETAALSTEQWCDLCDNRFSTPCLPPPPVLQEHRVDL